MKKYQSQPSGTDVPSGIRFVAKYYREDKMDTSGAWNKWRPQPERTLRRFSLPQVAAAATLLILLGTGFGWWKYSRGAEWITIRTQAGERKEILLPDHSSVYLDENSIFRYQATAYGEKQRNGELTGKAFFTVTHRLGAPFRVKTRRTEIRVLGTQFQVAAVPDSTAVAVKSGKVQCTSAKSGGIVLTGGMSACWRKSSTVPVVQHNADNLFSWKTHIFRFKDTSLTRVVQELENAYQVRITGLPDTTYRLNLSFREKSIDEILDIINRTLDTRLKSEPK